MLHLIHPFIAEVTSLLYLFLREISVPEDLTTYKRHQSKYFLDWTSLEEEVMRCMPRCTCCQFCGWPSNVGAIFTRFFFAKKKSSFQLTVEQLLVLHCYATRDWLKKLAPVYHPIKSKAKENRDSRAPCQLYVFTLSFDWFIVLSVSSLWLARVITQVWFYDTQLKTAL